jgi:hypothetical protein
MENGAYENRKEVTKEDYSLTFLLERVATIKVLKTTLQWK